MRRADSRAACTAGKSKATSTPIIATTTSSSTSVKPDRRESFEQHMEATSCKKRKFTPAKRDLSLVLGCLQPLALGNERGVDMVRIDVVIVLNRTAEPAHVLLQGCFVGWGAICTHNVIEIGICQALHLEGGGRIQCIAAAAAGDANGNRCEEED